MAATNPSRLQQVANRLPRLGGDSGSRAPRFGDGGVVRFVREVRSELRKVVWPSREEVKNLTIVVIAVSVAVGVLLGGVDAVFERLFRLVLGQ